MNQSEIQKIAPILNFLYPSCALQFRYNEYHVTKVQVLGRSRYTLVPNGLNKLIFPFPYSHLYRRQSQVSLIHAVKGHVKLYMFL